MEQAVRSVDSSFDDLMNLPSSYSQSCSP
jgi:hypothetical protein